MAISYERRPISVEDYHRMADAGIFAPDERVELLDGELIAVPPMGSPHGGAIGAITRLLTQRLNDRAAIRVQLPVIVDPRSEPEPDFAIVPLDAREWRDRHPVAADVLFLIEVADSSREFDLRKKAPVYARAGIAEVWVVDVVDRRLIVHREPTRDGHALTHILPQNSRIAPLAFPHEEFEVVAFTGP
ncbi:MAG TPA: Uma2 family endonuclease [Candidatus Baltobacteraceae bacterium]|nr:Uma2 family endonuclease [Candidatus Baltobacteraceae bacterium]